MTVRELIRALLELEMDADVKVIGNDSNSGTYEEFSDVEVSDGRLPFSGFDKVVEIQFQSGSIALIENDELERLQELEGKNK